MIHILVVSVRKGRKLYRKQLDQLTEFVKRPQIGSKGMVYARVEADGNVKIQCRQNLIHRKPSADEGSRSFSGRVILILILSGPDAMKICKAVMRTSSGSDVSWDYVDERICLSVGS